MDSRHAIVTVRVQRPWTAGIGCDRLNEEGLVRSARRPVCPFVAVAVQPAPFADLHVHSRGVGASSFSRLWSSGISLAAQLCLQEPLFGHNASTAP